MERLTAGAIARATVIILSIMAGGTPAWADAAADIRALEDRFVAAFKAKNVDAVMKVYAPGETLVVFDVVRRGNISALQPTARTGKAYSIALMTPSPSSGATSTSSPTATSPIVIALTKWPAPTSTARSSI